MGIGYTGSVLHLLAGGVLLNGYDFSEKGTLNNISLNKNLYKDIAVPMQGTSTGNAKELVGFFWEHFGDPEWVRVSNGGGYCRWQGLNDRPSLSRGAG